MGYIEDWFTWAFLVIAWVLFSAVVASIWFCNVSSKRPGQYDNPNVRLFDETDSPRRLKRKSKNLGE